MHVRDLGQYVRYVNVVVIFGEQLETLNGSSSATALNRRFNGKQIG